MTYAKTNAYTRMLVGTLFTLAKNGNNEKSQQENTVKTKNSHGIFIPWVNIQQ